MANDPTAGVAHKFELIIVTEEMKNSSPKVTGYRLRDIDLLFSSAKNPTQPCHCGVEVPVPYGSLSDYAKHLIQELGGDSIFVTSRVWHFYVAPIPKDVVEKYRKNGATDKSRSVHFPDKLPEKLGY